MTSASVSFLAFSLGVIVLYHMGGSPVWRRWVLLIASIVFIRWSSPQLHAQAYVPFAVFLVIGFAGVRLMLSCKSRLFVPALITIITTFVWLKHYAFIPAALFVKFPYFVLGLSYILFRILHLLIEAHSGSVLVAVGPLAYLTYTLNFTTLVSGPIQRFDEFTAAQTQTARLSISSVGRALERIIGGFFKVNVLALVFSALHSQALSDALVTNHPARFVAGLTLFVSYPLFLYCNFSGYIDLVVGISQLLCIQLPENFDRPFAADSFINFWSRWHITLSEWLKLYVYNPLLLALMRRYPSACFAPIWAITALFVTFVLIGVWHGQTSEFLFFGFLQGVGVAVNKLYQTVMTRKLGRDRYRRLSSNRLYVSLCRGVTFTWFTFTLVWFWASWKQIGAIKAALGPVYLAVWVVTVVGSSIVLAVWEDLRPRLCQVRWGSTPVLFSRYTRTVWSTAQVAIAVTLILLLNQPAPQIVYEAF